VYAIVLTSFYDENKKGEKEMSHLYNIKVGGGNQMQPYVPAGNGDKSGEYTNKSNGVFDKYSNNSFDSKLKDSSAFCEAYNCSAKKLEALLSEKEIESIVSYTDPTIGCAINQRLREGNATDDDLFVYENIVHAIKKFTLNKSVSVYRGINIKKDVYIEKFYKPYKKGLCVLGSKICSTSTDYKRALQGAITNKKGHIGLLFHCYLLKGDHALPVEALSVKPKDREILLASPDYYMTNIDIVNLDGNEIALIDIILVR